MLRYFVLCAGLILCISCVACESEEQKAANKATIENNEARKRDEALRQQAEENNRQRVQNRTNILDNMPPAKTKTNATSKQ